MDWMSMPRFRQIEQRVSSSPKEHLLNDCRRCAASVPPLGPGLRFNVTLVKGFFVQLVGSMLIGLGIALGFQSIHFSDARGSLLEPTTMICRSLKKMTRRALHPPSYRGWTKKIADISYQSARGMHASVDAHIVGSGYYDGQRV